MKWPKTFQRKITTIHAMRWTGDNYSDLRAWGAPVTFMADDEDLWLWVAANNGQLRLAEGEWIAQDEHGFYPIKDDHGTPFNYEELRQDSHA